MAAKPKANRKRRKAVLTTRQVAEIVRAESAYRRAHLAHEEAKAERQRVHERYQSYFPIGEDVDIHGVTVLVTKGSTGDRFRLSAAREAGHDLPPELQPFVTPAKDTYTWRLTVGEGLADGIVKLAA